MQAITDFVQDEAAQVRRSYMAAASVAREQVDHATDKMTTHVSAFINSQGSGGSLLPTSTPTPAPTCRVVSEGSFDGACSV